MRCWDCDAYDEANEPARERWCKTRARMYLAGTGDLFSEGELDLRREARRPMRFVVASGFVALASAAVSTQDFDRFPGFEVAAQVDHFYVMGNVLARIEDGACAFGPEILIEEAQRALLWNGIPVVVLTQPPQAATTVEGASLDVTAPVPPVLGTDAFAVSTGFQITIGGDAIAARARALNLLTWTATGVVGEGPCVGGSGPVGDVQCLEASTGRLVGRDDASNGR